MKEWQVRVLNEKAELDLRLNALAKFTWSDVFVNEVDIMERERLNTQKHLMTMLSGVLADRIANFK